MVWSNEITILSPALPFCQELRTCERQINCREGSQQHVTIKITNCEIFRRSCTYSMYSTKESKTGRSVHNQLSIAVCHVTLKVI
jgi:hypothetical protein